MWTRRRWTQSSTDEDRARSSQRRARDPPRRRIHPTRQDHVAERGAPRGDQCREHPGRSAALGPTPSNGGSHSRWGGSAAASGSPPIEARRIADLLGVSRSWLYQNWTGPALRLADGSSVCFEAFFGEECEVRLIAAASILRYVDARLEDGAARSDHLTPRSSGRYGKVSCSPPTPTSNYASRNSRRSRKS